MDPFKKLSESLFHSTFVEFRASNFSVKQNARKLNEDISRRIKINKVKYGKRENYSLPREEHRYLPTFAGANLVGHSVREKITCPSSKFPYP